MRWVGCWIYVDCCQTTLYIRVPINFTKRMKKAPIFWCMFLNECFLLAHCSQPLFKNGMVSFIIFYTNIYEETCTAILSGVRRRVNTQNIYLYLCTALTFQILLGMLSKSLCQSLIYIIIYTMNKYHWVYKFSLDFYKRPFSIFLQTIYLTTGSNLSLVKPVTVKLVAS